MGRGAERARLGGRAGGAHTVAARRPDPSAIHRAEGAPWAAGVVSRHVCLWSGFSMLVGRPDPALWTPHNRRAARCPGAGSAMRDRPERVPDIRPAALLQ